ncbi:unnamed protein product [Darwinula stevensoni]|uniref:4-hydroxybenzoate polyprenyltransferase, mitochondrial n=1 Tax=Darwinula stevensoni TaxID=69355 RepID=A0A7R8X4N3_9CRUS|nr:unnamed protein product [Darwinula stevensoni]CAG0879707.1 unnamed protein product [Darwinula stevensoni]
MHPCRASLLATLSYSWTSKFVKNKYGVQDCHVVIRRWLSNSSRFASTAKTEGIEPAVTLPERLVSSAPIQLQPFLQLMRLDKPTGTWLLFLPCAWSAGLAADPGCFPDFRLLSLFAAGSIVMRGAGCTVNDLWDKEFDKRVHRTQERPLANGAMLPVQALAFLGCQLSVGLIILLQMNLFSIILATSSLGLVVAYPLFKRFTYWPQLMLGITYNWGTLVGWSAVAGSCNLSVCLPLYLSGIFWTLYYDTIYAHQDKADDVIVGIKSSALKLGDQTKFWLIGFSSLFILNQLLAGINCGQTWPFYASIATAAGMHAQQIQKVDLNDANSCMNTFRAQRNIGLIILLGVILGTLTRKFESICPSHQKHPCVMANQDELKERLQNLGVGDCAIETEQQARSMRKREDYLEWQEYFMAIAFLSAMRSKDPVTQVGACIVNSEKKIVGIGYNGMPIGCSDDELPWDKTNPDQLLNKYMYVCHAEMNAIMNKNSADVKGCTIYVALFPCNECAKIIIQAGITHIIYMSDKHNNKPETIASKRMFDLAGITYVQFQPKRKKFLIDFDAIDSNRPNSVL